jgi:hypothetical protein
VRELFGEISFETMLILMLAFYTVAVFETKNSLLHATSFSPDPVSEITNGVIFDT